MAKSISRRLADSASPTGAIDGTLSTAAQTNITSVGTLSALTVSGALTANGGIALPDDGVLSLGTSDELTLKHHNSGYSHLINTTGTLYVDSDSVTFRDDDGSPSNMVISQTGINVTGNVTANPSGGVITLGASGQITSKQSLDVATAGGRFIGSSNRGILGQIRIEQTANSTDGGYIAFDTSPSGSTSPAERVRIQSGGNIRVNPSTTDYNGHSNVDEYLFTAQTSFNASGDQSLNIVNHNGNWLDGTTGSDTAYGLMWGYGNHVRAGVHYDHRSTEKFDIYSSYGSIRLRTPNSVSGNISPIGSETTMPAGLEVNPGGSVTMAKQPTAVYTHSAGSEAGAYAYSWTSTGSNELICKPQLAVVNVGSIYTPSNGRFTAPVAGIYRYAVHGNLYTLGVASTAYFAIRIRKGNGHYLMHFESNSTRNGNGWVYMNAAGLISLAANEYITFSVETNQLTATGVNKLGFDTASYTHYEFHKIS